MKMTQNVCYEKFSGLELIVKSLKSGKGSVKIVFNIIRREI